MEQIKDFGDMLNRIGPQGKYQKGLLYGISTPVVMFAPLMNLIPIFLFQVSDHWCKLPNSENLGPEELKYLKSISLPIVSGPDGLPRFSQCQMFNNGSTIDCPNGWDYDRKDLSATFATEFDWVCTKSHYSTTMLTLIEAGGGVGTVLFGTLADRIGRRPVFFIGLSIYLSLRLLSCFVAKYFTILAAVTFIGSMGRSIFNLMAIVILHETCDDEMRGYSVSFLFGAYVIGAASTPYIAYFASNWFYIVLVTTLPCFLLYLLWFFLPESSRWLAAVGRTEEAAAGLRKVAAMNGTLDKISEFDLEHTLEVIHKVQRDNSTKPNFRMLLGTSLLARRVIFLIICLSANDLVFDVITLNTPNMAGDQFLNFFLLTIIETPSCIVGGLLVGRIGRRTTGTCFELLTTVNCFICAAFLASPSLKIVVIISTFIAKFSVNLTCLVNDIQASEILPTPLRATGTSMAVTVANIISIFGPLIVLSGSYDVSMPYWIMGVVVGCATIAASLLPETINQDLPETVESANEFGKNTSYWNFIPPKKSTGQRNGLNSTLA